MHFRAIITAFAMILSLPTAAGQCAYWEINGDYVIRQSNAIDVALHLEREGNRLTGQARFHSTSYDHDISGPLEGHVDGDRLHFRVNWYVLEQESCLKYYGLIPVWCWTREYDEHGIYEGTISSHGEVQGSNYPFERPAARTDWFMKSELECGEIAMLPGIRHGAPRPEGVGTRVLHPADWMRDEPANLDARVSDPRPIEPTQRPIRVLGKAGGSGDPCLEGFVWREARKDDHVCVPPQSRLRVAQENRLAVSRRVPGGPDTCISGFVWREAFEGDTVCVPPPVRELVWEENRQAQTRRKPQ